MSVRLGPGDVYSCPGSLVHLLSQIVAVCRPWQETAHALTYVCVIFSTSSTSSSSRSPIREPMSMAAALRIGAESFWRLCLQSLRRLEQTELASGICCDTLPLYVHYEPQLYLQPVLA